jgi:hypothetical protein
MYYYFAKKMPLHSTNGVNWLRRGARRDSSAPLKMARGPVTRDPMGIYSIRVPIWSKTSTHGYINGANLSPIGYAGMETF